MKRCLLIFLALCLVCPTGKAQSKLADEFQPVCDSLAVLAKERFGNKGERLELWKAVKRSGKYDLYFSRELADWPWKEEDQKWFRAKLNELYPEKYKALKGGAIFCRNTPFEDLLTPVAGNSGRAPGYRYAPRKNEPAYMVRQQGARTWKKGLSGRNIAVWQSHGRYYNEKEDQWMWQRAPIHRTIEDLYTQSYVLPFLIPMLENAGAYVMTPRERDTNPYEIICDNDPAFGRDTVTADFGGLPLRAAGKYSESGNWSDAGEGFADLKAIYTRGDNPFRMGRSRTARCTSSVKASATAVWSADVPVRGEYAVYVSYHSTPNSSRNAVYTVSHLGGKSHFCVNQRMGGGGWVYLGSFEFAPEKGAQVSLDNSTPLGCNYEKNSIVSADAVKIGGGIGKIARGRDSVDVVNWSTSGVPSYLEGAMYWMQWAGIDYDTVINQWDRDYTRDYASRGAWVNEMKEGRGVPFDLSLALHSDAGTSPDDSIVGTLAIYSLLSNGSRKFSDGRDRMAGRLLADYVQTQVTDDLRAGFDDDWSRRDIRDRSYSESRTPDLPALLLELLSHQNLADMKYGHDPAFKFSASRAIYKGILKFLSTWYGVPYSVQPLPVNNFSAMMTGPGKVQLSWKDTEDTLEPTAKADGYIVYTRVDDGAFDSGIYVSGTSLEFNLESGKLYSWKVEAYNEGGRSFPSETLSAGFSPSPRGKVLVVNNFTRLSAPAWFDTPYYAGFDAQQDGGVSYIRDISYCGDNYEMRRAKDWVSDYAPGFGASGTEQAGLVVAGNTFDYPSVHGRALMDCGWSFCSCSASAFDGEGDYDVVDLICGKQLSSIRGDGGRPALFQVFPGNMRDALEKAADRGCCLLVSGSRIATDAWDSVYPIADTSLVAEGVSFAEYQKEAREFVADVLGYKWVSSRAGTDGMVHEKKGFGRYSLKYYFATEPNPDKYCVENCDGLKPAGNADRPLLYFSNRLAAAILHDAGTYKAASFAFPLECLSDAESLRELMGSTLETLISR